MKGKSVARRYLWIIGIGLFFILNGCKKDRLNVNVANIKSDIKIHRFDVDFFGQDTSSLLSTLNAIRKNDSAYFDIYTEAVLHIGQLHDPKFEGYLKSFVTDTVYRKVADSVLSQFSDLTDIEQEVNKGFRYYLYYYPGAEIPKIYSQISGFNQSVVVADSAIGLSLDQYMGPDCIFYQYLGIHKYKREIMYPSKMVADLFYAFASANYPFNPKTNNLLANMIYQGQLLYFAEAMCHDLPDSVLIGYSQHQLLWCKANHAVMWDYLVEHKLIFSSERMTIRKFLGEAPYTNDFTSESPGRAGVWLGWQIIRSYMNKNMDVTLPQMMEMNDYQEILAKSAYHPD